MATGKTVGRHIRVKFDSTDGTVRNITCSIKTINGIGLNYEQVDITALCDSVMKSLTGQADSEVSMTGEFDNTPVAADPSDSGAHAVLAPYSASPQTAGTLTIEFGIRTDPTTGDPIWTGEYRVTEYLVNVQNNVGWSAKFKPASGTPAWGTKS